MFFSSFNDSLRSLWFSTLSRIGINRSKSLNMPSATEKPGYWTPVEKQYQKVLQITEGDSEPTIRFPLVLEPVETPKSKQEVLEALGRIGAQPSDTSAQSPLRKMLDANGGVVHFKGMPFKTADDFSDLLVAMAGKGEHAWKPHVDVGMEVLRRPRAKHVLTTNE